ncbi:choice-of-anchor L domain-containing protein, partial [Kordia jejudonensis]|uniref:choice-of-anchor L domain-containing protein n=1 Tax=Kordia jejudonensis TaxID=1348245 RepID=UPI0006290924
MRTKILSILLLLIGHQVYSQQITVDDTLDPEFLIIDVLFRNVCGNEPDNIRVTNHSGADNWPSEQNGANLSFESYGFFDSGTADFPFPEGVVLSSSNVTAIPNNGAGILSFGGGGNWTGDPDLQVLTGNGTVENATAIEFSFVPLSTQISFRYILASEEYTTSNSYPCSFADTFAFILSGPGIPNSNLYDHDANPATPELNLDLGGRNIALLPNSNIPASITNIHNFTCGPGLGQFAFPEFYDTVGSNNGSTAFDGQTVALTAQADVIPGQTYIIKLVVSDFFDTQFDSAVFLEGGSFDIGSFDLGDDRLITTGNPVCEGEIITLDATYPVAGATYVWSLDNVVLPGETNPTLDVSAPGVYSVEVLVSANCSTNDTITIEFAPVPVANEPNDLLACSPAGITNVEFDLSLVNNDVLLTQNAADFDITYHPTLADAEMNTNPLPTLYTSGSSLETIFVRLENTLIGCFATTDFELQVYVEPVANTVTNVVVCDDPSNDGVEDFVLTDNNIQVLGTQDASLFTITYHGSMDDALNNAAPLPTTYQNQNLTAPETIYVRIENNNNTECSTVSQFDIQVNPVPIANQPDDMLSCDQDANGTEDYDLTTQETAILGTQNAADFNISYHPTQDDADMDTNPLPTMYTGSLGETVYVRIESALAGNDCYATTMFDLLPSPLPVQVTPTTLEECDDDTDGFVGFTLTEADAEIIAGQTSADPMIISYYLTPGEAMAGGGSPLPASYINEMADMQTVHIRVENAITGCYTTSTVDLLVNPMIVATTPTNYSVCDDTNGNDTDGLGTFDLSTKDAEILGPLAGSASVRYYTNQLAAETEDPTFEIIGLYTSTSSLESVYARVEDNTTGCPSIVELVLIVNPLPNLDNIPPMIACDVNNPTDMMEIFDLTTHTTVVENGQVGLTITYHPTETEAQMGTGAITTINATDGDFVWVRAVNLLGCIQTGNFSFEVNPLPVFAVPTNLDACDDETADGIAP